MQTNRQNKNVRKYVRDDSKYLYVRAESHTHTHEIWETPNNYRE